LTAFITASRHEEEMTVFQPILQEEEMTVFQPLPHEEEMTIFQPLSREEVMTVYEAYKKYKIVYYDQFGGVIRSIFVRSTRIFDVLI